MLTTVKKCFPGPSRLFYGVQFESYRDGLGIWQSGFVSAQFIETLRDE
jgi:hypothetical protein